MNEFVFTKQQLEMIVNDAATPDEARRKAGFMIISMDLRSAIKDNNRKMIIFYYNMFEQIDPNCLDEQQLRTRADIMRDMERLIKIWLTNKK